MPDLVLEVTADNIHKHDLARYTGESVEDLLQAAENARLHNTVLMVRIPEGNGIIGSNIFEAAGSTPVPAEEEDNGPDTSYVQFNTDVDTNDVMSDEQAAMWRRANTLRRHND